MSSSNFVSITQTVYPDLGALGKILTYNGGVKEVRGWVTKHYSIDGIYQSGVIEVDPYTTSLLVQRLVYDEVLTFLDSLELQECRSKGQLVQKVEHDLKGETEGYNYLVMSQLTYEEVGNIGGLVGKVGTIILNDELLGCGYIYLVGEKSILCDVKPQVQLEVRGRHTTLTVKQRIKYCGGLQRAYYLQGSTES